MHYEADTRHPDLLIKEILGDGDKSKAVATPGVKEEHDESAEQVRKHIEGVKQQMSKKKDEKETVGPARKAEIARYRSIAAMANFLVLDRCDIQSAVKEIARKMCDPGLEDELKLRRLALYFKRKTESGDDLSV